MFLDLTDPIKDGVIMFLSRQRRLTQFLPEERIFAMQVPANPEYPFLRFGTPIPTPYESLCWVGTSLRVTLDVFAQGDPGEDPGEVQIGRLSRILVDVMNHLDLGDGLGIVTNDYLGTSRSIVDQEADRWRAMVEFNITAVQTAN